MIKKSEKSKLGMLPWFIPAYFKKTQASKLGDAQGIPSSSTTYQVTSSETIFLFRHILCALLGASVCFCFFFFCFCLNKSYPSILCLGERYTPLFRMNKYVLSFILNVHCENWTISFIVIWLETENAACGKWYNVLNNVILGNCCAHIDLV